MADQSTCQQQVKDNFEQQINEVELLESVYSEAGEFKIEDESAFSLAKAYTSGDSLTYPKSLSYSVHLSMTEEDGDNEEEGEVVVDICCRTHVRYPQDLPEVYVRSENFSRNNQDKFNGDLKAFMIQEILSGEVCMYTLIEWIKQEVFEYCSPPSSAHTNSVSKHEDDSLHSNDKNFSRMWLYMHHIYSKIKRRNILSLSKEYDLSGFCLPGKPGVVCVEGSVHNTSEFYGILRRWNWKSITCRDREVSDCSAACTIDSQRKFQGFQELAFDVHGPRGNHLDLGQFKRYLSEHGLDSMFKELFGVEGK